METEKKPIKICHVATIDFAIRFLMLNQLKWFQEKGYDVSVVCSPGPWIAEIEQAGLRVHTIPMSRSITPLQDIRSLWGLIRYFRQERFSIVHTHTPKAGLLGTWAAAFTRVPIIIHSNLGFYFHEHSSWLKKQTFIWLERLTALFASVVFSVDKEDIETARAKHIGDPKALRYLGGWVDLQRFNPGKFSSYFTGQKKRELGVATGQKIIGIVARLVEEKGYLELFEAFQKVLEKHPNTLLLIVGPEEPEKQDAVRPQVAKKYGFERNVKFLGVRTDVEEIYAVLDVFTLPSHREGIGISILEASAMQLPIVATNVRGCREAVDDGVTGILVPHKNPEKLAEALLWMLEHPQEAKRMGEAGRRKIEREFDERLVFGRLEQEYGRLIKEKLNPAKLSIAYLFFKRVMDIAVALAALLVLGPLLLVVAVLVKLDSPGSVFFHQERMGKNGKVFRIVKFRTMVQDADSMQVPVEQVRAWEAKGKDPRITRVGRWLRRWGIDEFPQFFNVLKGEMSLVGPRPYYLKRMDSDPSLRERLSIKPGFVSLALVRGGVRLSEEEIKKYDEEYIQKRNLWLDIAILLRAVFLVVSGRGF